MKLINDGCDCNVYIYFVVMNSKLNAKLSYSQISFLLSYLVEKSLNSLVHIMSHTVKLLFDGLKIMSPSITAKKPGHCIIHCVSFKVSIIVEYWIRFE